MKKNISGVLAVTGLIGTAGLGILQYLAFKNTKNFNEQHKRLKGYYEVLSLWLDMKRENRDFSEYFESNGIKTIAVYGMGDLGIHLCNDLLELKNVDVKYCIDNLMEDKDALGYKIITTDELHEAEEVDAIIVTPMHQFEAIKKKLFPYNDRVISLEDIFYM